MRKLVTPHTKLKKVKTAPRATRPPYFRGYTLAFRHTTISRTALNK